MSKGNPSPAIKIYMERLKERYGTDKRKLIQAMLDEGKTYEGVANILGQSRQSVHDFMKRFMKGGEKA